MSADRAASPAPLSHLRVTPLREFLYGVAYYPEHWDPATRAADPALFRAAGWNVVRMAEFAWDLIEPREGVFDFTLFDETLERLGTHGIRAILCTPTATPPRWLTRDHPEILRVDADGRRQEHGSRQHASHFSPLFREYSRKITRALAHHYRSHPHVLGWQTDNEIHCHFREDYCPPAETAWHTWLHARFGGDITALNRAWGTAFWAQTYARFEDVVLPRHHRPTHLNPAHWLDYQRFLSDGAAAFQRDQIDILRDTNPRWFVTHNGCFPAIDYRGPFTRDLDFLGFDAYPFFNPRPADRPSAHAFHLDLVRAYSGHFLLLEQQSGAGGQGDYFHDKPEPGEMRRLAWGSIARGADGLLFFRERSCRFGAEEYWEGILEHDNVPRRRYHEAARLGSELARFGAQLLGATVLIDIAVAGGDFDAQHGHAPITHGLPSPKNMAEAVHGVFYRAGHAVGVVHPADTLAGLRLYLIPHFALFDPAWLPGLETFVAAGGTLVIGARSASRDLRGNVVPDTFPGILRPLAGATVEEFGRQNQPTLRPLALRPDGADSDLPTELWYEQLSPDPAAGTEVVARWTTRHLAGSPAITRRRLGAGQVLYVGTYLTRDFTERALLPLLSRLGALPPPVSTTPEVEIVERIHPDGRTLRIVINHRDQPVSISTPHGAARDYLTDRALPPDGTLSLEPHGVALLGA
jgi:beta-galactosidase